MIRVSSIMMPGAPGKAGMAQAKPLVAHGSPKCQGCPYGDRQPCVGICWKEIYDSMLNKRKKKDKAERL